MRIEYNTNVRQAMYTYATVQKSKNEIYQWEETRRRVNEIKTKSDKNLGPLTPPPIKPHLTFFTQCFDSCGRNENWNTILIQNFDV